MMRMKIVEKRQTMKDDMALQGARDMICRAVWLEMVHMRRWGMTNGERIWPCENRRNLKSTSKTVRPRVHKASPNLDYVISVFVRLRCALCTRSRQRFGNELFAAK